MATQFDICIRGAGIVGRTLALHLAGKQMRVALVGADLPAKADVRAYALNQTSRQLLEAVRCWPEPTDATPVLAMQVYGDEGGQVAFSASEQGTDALNWIVDVPALEARLQEAVRFQPLIEVVDGPVPAALTVVCEGRVSSSREEFGVEWDVTPYGQSALATRVQCARAHNQVAQQWFDQGEILAFLPLGGAQGSVCAVVWSLSPERASQMQAEPEEAFCAALQAASHDSLGALTLTGARSVWSLQQALARRWIGQGPQGAWALAGDAAHNMHPLAGQGLNMGLSDVADLVRVLSERPYWRTLDDPRLLRQYERSRKAEFAVLGQANDALQRIFTQPNAALRSLRNWGMNQFERSGSIKHWVARRAMGDAALPPLPWKTTP
ncbi:MAG: FAD-dependent monooxygenase [Burkholderiales bacterium]|nr:FAD-dependent monooxygenase [Burkholderiales bacterium]